MTAPAWASPVGFLPGRIRELLTDASGLPALPRRHGDGTGGVVRLRSGGAGPAVVTDPGLARALLHHPTGLQRPAGAWSCPAGAWSWGWVCPLPAGDGPAAPQGTPYPPVRARISPSLQREALRAHSSRAARIARRYAATLRDGRRIDLLQEMSSLALDLLQAGVFGSRPGDVPPQARRSQAVLTALLPFPNRAVDPAPLADVRVRRRICREAAALGAAIAGRLAEHRAGRGSDGVLPLVLAARDRRTGARLPEHLLREEVLALLLAGHETVSTALTWAWYELDRSAGAAELLAAELRRPQARRALQDGSWRDLPVARAVIAETLRLHPATLVLGRRATRTFVLGPEVIHRGTLCVVSPYGLHRDPRSWPDPLSWRPERWLNARGRFDPAAPGQPRGAYLPFGARSRICAAETLVTAQSTLVLAVLAESFRVRVAGHRALDGRQGLPRGSRGRFPAVPQHL